MSSGGKPARVRIGVAVLALAAVTGMSGCQTETRDPKPTTPVTHLGTATPTASPTSVAAPPAPRSPVAGGCDALLADAGVAAATGGADASASDELWDVALETIGGLSCAFGSESLRGQVIMLPVARADELDDDLRAQGCVREYDEVVCSASEVSGETWVLVRTAHAGDDIPDAVTDSQTAVLAAAGAVVEEEVPVGVGTPGAAVDCEAVSGRLAVTDILGPGEIFPSRIEEGSGPIERRIADQTSASMRCDWSELDDFREIGVVVIPGGAWAAEAQTADAGEPRDIGGTEGYLVARPSGETGVLSVVAGDLVWVWSRGLDEAVLLKAAAAFVQA